MGYGFMEGRHSKQMGSLVFRLARKRIWDLCLLDQISCPWKIHGAIITIIKSVGISSTHYRSKITYKSCLSARESWLGLHGSGTRETGALVAKGVGYIARIWF